jgi:hypothetical protein
MEIRLSAPELKVVCVFRSRSAIAGHPEAGDCEFDHRQRSCFWYPASQGISPKRMRLGLNWHPLDGNIALVICSRGNQECPVKNSFEAPFVGYARRCSFNSWAPRRLRLKHP